MKNMVKILGVIVIATALCFAAIAQSASTSASELVSGDEISLNVINQQVYNENGTPFTGNHDFDMFFDFLGVYNIGDIYPNYSVKAVNGKLTISLKAPNEMGLTAYLKSVKPAGTQGHGLMGFFLLANDTNLVLRKDTKSFIAFFYSDSDDTLNGKCVNNKLTYKNVKLKKGWNTVKLDGNTVTNGSPDAAYKWTIIFK